MVQPSILSVLPEILSFFATRSGFPPRIGSLTLGNSAPRGALGSNQDAVTYGNACGSNDGHGDPDDTTLPCAHSSSCADSDAHSSPTDAPADHFALCADCLDRRNACGANVGYDNAVYAGWLHSCRTGYDFDGFHDNPDRWSSRSTNERSDPAFYMCGTDSGAIWSDFAAMLSNGPDRRLRLPN